MVKTPETGVVRDTILRIRVSPVEKRQIQRAADKGHNGNVSRYLRHLLLLDTQKIERSAKD